MCNCSGRIETATLLPLMKPGFAGTSMPMPPGSVTRAAAPSSLNSPASTLVVPTNSVDEQRLRRVVDFGRRRNLLDRAARHHRDAVGHRQRLFLVVGDQDGGDAVFADCSRLTSICMSSRRFLSSAPNGSSSSSTLGSMARQRASAMRCCWPPENCRGLRSREFAHVDERRASRRRAARSCRAAIGAPAGHRRRCPPPSCAETARSSGTRCRRRAGSASDDRPARRRTARGLRSAG